MACLRLVVLMAAAVVALASALGAQEATAPGAVLSPGEQRIRSALDGVALIEFIETPLADIAAFLADAHQIPVQFNVAALAEARINTDLPLTANLRGVSLRTALRRLLGEHYLTYRIDDEVLVITTWADAVRNPATRVYPVAHLMDRGAASADALAQLVRATVQQNARMTEAGVSATVVAYGPVLVVRDTEEGHHEVQKLLTQLGASIASLRQQANPFGAPSLPGQP